MEKSIYTREYAVFLEHLRKARETKNLTQTEVAQQLDQTQSFVSKIERGERRIDIVELRAFCRAIGVPFPQFVAEIDQFVEEGRCPESKNDGKNHSR